MYDLVDVIGLGVIIPVVPKLIEDLNVKDLSQASKYGGCWFSLCSDAISLFGRFMGGLSDRFGRKDAVLPFFPYRIGVD